MKPKLLPLYFKSGRDDNFDRMLSTLTVLLKDEADILSPKALRSKLPKADAVFFPQLLGDAFSQLKDFKKIKLPILVITSEFGTVNMWDWEIVHFLKSAGLLVFAPYTREMTAAFCRALGWKHTMKSVRFALYQDNPGNGLQPDIFKRFYWWEKSCDLAIRKKFGVTLIKKSYRSLAAFAKKIPDAKARIIAGSKKLNAPGVSNKSMSSAIKLYMALKQEAKSDPRILGMGINCLNESHFSDTTPCLAWTLLFDELGINWACEADTVSLMTQFLMNRTLNRTVIMSNVYPFLVGKAALKHEKIDAFPKVDRPENHLLIVHCGYFGLMPNSCACKWALRPKVLDIVDQNATAIDGRISKGPVTLVKLDPSMKRLMVIQGEITQYVQYAGSDCRNGGVIRIRDGHKLMKSFYSHHYCIIKGDCRSEIDMVSEVFNLKVESY
jgi:hypothetical protein